MAKIESHADLANNCRSKGEIDPLIEQGDEITFPEVYQVLEFLF